MGEVCQVWQQLQEHEQGHTILLRLPRRIRVRVGITFRVLGLGFMVRVRVRVKFRANLTETARLQPKASIFIMRSPVCAWGSGL